MTVIKIYPGKEKKASQDSVAHYLCHTWEGQAAGHAVYAYRSEREVMALTDTLVNYLPRVLAIEEFLSCEEKEPYAVNAELSLVHARGTVRLGKFCEHELEDIAWKEAERQAPAGLETELEAAEILSDPVLGPYLAIEGRQQFKEYLRAGLRPFIMVMAEEQGKSEPWRESFLGGKDHPYFTASRCSEAIGHLVADRRIPVIFAVRAEDYPRMAEKARQLMEGAAYHFR